MSWLTTLLESLLICLMVVDRRSNCALIALDSAKDSRQDGALIVWIILKAVELSCASRVPTR